MLESTNFGVKVRRSEPAGWVQELSSDGHVVTFMVSPPLMLYDWMQALFCGFLPQWSINTSDQVLLSKFADFYMTFSTLVKEKKLPSEHSILSYSGSKMGRLNLHMNIKSQTLSPLSSPSVTLLLSQSQPKYATFKYPGFRYCHC